MPERCLICNTELITKPEQPDEGQAYECERCGKYLLSINTEKEIQRRSFNEEQITILSHTIRKMQKQESPPAINLDIITAILKRPLPTLTEQVNNLITWLAEQSSPGEFSHIHTFKHQSVVGAKSQKGFGFILDHLIDRKLLDVKQFSRMGDCPEGFIALSFNGWEYYRQLEKGVMNSRKAFMAMKYGDKEFDKIVDDYFRQAVADTGFELYRLDEEPKAGLIDDRLRVEIRNSRFLISDLTHDNNGAYWEAGYAEGLGKPVIYTCKKEKFDEDKPHFDTNHHLTVIWDENEIEKAVKLLKATIRATLPDEAKLSDD